MHSLIYLKFLTGDMPPKYVLTPSLQNLHNLISNALFKKEINNSTKNIIYSFHLFVNNKGLHVKISTSDGT